MIGRIAEHIGSPRLAGRQRGGVAIIMLVGFIGLAVPLAAASIQTAGQLSRNSRVYDSRLTGMYNAGAGIEVAIHEIISDPAFDDDLSQGSPSKSFDVSPNGDTVTVTVTKIFGQATMQGQGIVVSKSVTPQTATANATTTYAYTITMENEGTGDAEINQVYDYLPPGFAYVPGSTSGITTSEPTLNQNAPATCGAVPYELFWNVQPDNVIVGAGQTATLTFNVTATVPDGEYVNQASVRYNPWWSSPDIYTYSAYAEEVVVTVGGGAPPKCGYDMQVLVTTNVDPADPEPDNDPQEFTYTITVENVSTDTVYVCKIEDFLPPGFTYQTGSATGVDDSEPDLTWDSTAERWDLEWADGSGGNLNPLISIAAGDTEEQVFKADGIVESGVTYYNEIDVTWSKTLLGNGKCDLGGSSGGTFYGGAGGPTDSVVVSTLYDIQAVASDGSVRSRVILSSSGGPPDILSWQEW